MAVTDGVFQGPALGTDGSHLSFHWTHIECHAGRFDLRCPASGGVDDDIGGDSIAGGENHMSLLDRSDCGALEANLTSSARIDQGLDEQPVIHGVLARIEKGGPPD